MPSTVRLICSNPACRVAFDKPRNEYERRTRQGHGEFFCTLTCGAVLSNARFPRKGDASHLDPGNKRDELTPFRWFVARARYRKRKGPTNVPPSYLKELWEAQNGICPFTGWQLLLPDSTQGWKEGLDPRNASLDRIDNARGYIQGNVRFISLMANLARAQFSDDTLRAFCRAVNLHGHTQN